MVNIRIARVQNPEDLKLKAEPYMIKGRMKVSFINEKWEGAVIPFVEDAEAVEAATEAATEAL